MSGLVILALYLLWPSTASAGQASAQFQVGIIITGKRASSAPPSKGASTEAPAATRAKPFSRVAHRRGMRYCSERYRSYAPATQTYIGRDGNVHRCP
jgi:hypothetical protein